MKRLLLLLLISPLTFAEVYNFICVEDVSRKTATIIVDTEEKYIQLGGVKFAFNYTDTSTNISARIDEERDNVMTFNKITGKATQVSLQDGYWYEYSCRPAERLIP